MGHAINYYSVAKRSEIMKVAEQHAMHYTDIQENPNGNYHGNMTIHDDIICESREEAEAVIESLDRGWYDDHAVRYKIETEPTKQMLGEKARGERIMQAKLDYEEKHSLFNRKSKTVKCKHCESVLTISYLSDYKCPVCNTDLRADYIVERIKKYIEEYKDSLRRYNELKDKQKCPTMWLVKVEVHC